MVDVVYVGREFPWVILYVMSASRKIKPSVKNNKKKTIFAYLFNFNRMDLIVVQCDVPW